MDGKVLEDRRLALENSFFHKESERLLDDLRGKAAREELARASGISNEAVLKSLEADGINASTVAALSLVPLVWVAWADYDMESGESSAVLKAAAMAGIADGSEAQQLITGWLANRPSEALFRHWQEYVAATTATMDDADRQRLRDEVTGRARAVAEAAGGFLGIAKISQAERDALAEIERSFE